MLTEKKYFELFVEYEEKDVHVDIHLSSFNKKNIYPILTRYINRYKDREVNLLSVKFWETKIAGDYLSLMRKNSGNVYLAEPLYGIKFIPAIYSYLDTSKVVGKVSVISG